MSPKNLLLLGSTGPTGQLLLAQSLKQGHNVTAFVRNASKLTLTHERLRIVTGSDIADLPALTEAVRGQDVVISALGVGTSLKPGGLIARATHAVVTVLEKEGVRRLIFTSGFGVADTFRDAPLVLRIIFRTLLRGIYRDKAAGDAELRQSKLDWTLVYPTRLTDGPKTGRYQAGERLVSRSAPSMSRADAAEFLLTQVDDRTYVRKGVVVCG